MRSKADVRAVIPAFFIAAAIGVVGSLQANDVGAAGTTSCENLASLVLPAAGVTSAQVVAAGAFTPPGPGRSGAVAAPVVARGGAPAPRGGGPSYRSLPAFCRIAATLTPTSDSDIKIEVWLPVSGWNGKFQAVGNGGWAGTISYAALASAVAAGYAGASTDTGHVGNSARFAVGHPEKVVDFAYRSVHEMTINAKAIIQAHYGQPPSTSFWNGCSQGGRQGLAEAQRYPADFDGIVAGASAWNNMQLHAGRIALNQMVNASPDSYIPPSKYPMLHEAVLNACDRLDGVEDGVLENPAQCHFDPQVLQCKAVDDQNCLTGAQVATARAMYAPIKHPKSGEIVYPGLRPGSELVWGVTGGTEPVGTALEGLKYVVFGDAGWDWHRFDLAADLDRAIKTDKGILATNDANLKPFFDRGGKLLLYHGWTDTQVAPDQSVIYFNKVIDNLGRNAAGNSIQLLMVPGMNHCQGGAGTDSFDRMAAIAQWTQTGKAPDRIIASHLTDGSVDRTRPLCPYPQVATYKGSGSTNDAANFVCK
jgi:feruloyl esterase